ncbi:type I pullulanase [Acidaminobacter sp. JC074]|uniref:type I pullulanase n=1 Tax=Acidaminobacter sp. JC074 TaxID=2530199 RepID=UPI001F0D48C2|nr:type I pullulanase [Acidaminobacter sp. JC074]MCH4888284.1 type I pullulanase [Acidaminobacter sp. JC074]
MKRLLASLLILLQCFLLIPMQAVAEENTTVVIHYQETEDNDKDWNLWIWPAGGEGSANDFTEEDNFGKVCTVTLPGKHEKVGFIVRTDSWEKDTPNDRFIDQFDGGVGEIWVYGGREEFFYENPEGADEITDESVELMINYHNYDENYANTSLRVYFFDEVGQTISLDGQSDFGPNVSLRVEETKGKAGILVDVLENDQVLATYEVKKIKDGQAEIFLVENNERVFYSEEDAVYMPKITKARLNDTKTIELETNMFFKGPIEVYVNGELVTSQTSIEMSGDFYQSSGNIILDQAVKYTDEIELSIPRFETSEVQLGQIYDTLEFNSTYNYEGDLGPIYSKTSTTFKVWAPTAKDVNLTFFTDVDTPAESYEMTMSEKGVWETRVEGDLHNQLYAYDVSLFGDYEYVVDPYAKGVSVNGLRSAVIDLDSTDPENWQADYTADFSSITDAIMYEIHVRDLSMHGQSGIENKGLFLGFTETNTQTKNGFTTGLDYIADLGVTHIQFMPIYDYGSINEAKNDYSFNWGYDPVNYNALEGSYSTDAFTPDVRIGEFKQAVQAIHDKGLKVTMDVVYNHVYSVDAMAFEKLVPGYYFRKEGENFANGSGCGNETASERFMMRKFMVDSVTYLADEYNLDGFRFDLMGLHDVETMNQIRQALDPSITVIGEGWNMGSVLDEASKANQNQAHLMPGIAHFNDTIRDGLKGSVFDSLDQGFINGKEGMEATVFTGIVGGVYYEDLKTWGDIEPGQSVTYVEAHDNNTLFDKLKLSNPEAMPNEIKDMHLLADTIILTSQGVPFIHAGQEFLRTKLGDENSYKSSDIVNRLDWSRREKYDDVVSYFTTLIEMRKAHPAFRLATKEEIQESIKPIQLDNQVIAYEINYADDAWDNIIVIHNAGKSDQSFDLNGDYQVVVKDGQANLEGIEQVAASVKVPAMSSMVLYRIGDLEEEMPQADSNTVNTLIVGIVVILALATILIIIRKRK